jgi:hypothetical protein
VECEGTKWEEKEDFGSSKGLISRRFRCGCWVGGGKVSELFVVPNDLAARPAR